MSAVWGWLVDDWQWPYGGALFLAVLLLAFYVDLGLGLIAIVARRRALAS